MGGYEPGVDGNGKLTSGCIQTQQRPIGIPVTLLIAVTREGIAPFQLLYQVAGVVGVIGLAIAYGIALALRCQVQANFVAGDIVSTFVGTLAATGRATA